MNTLIKTNLEGYFKDRVTGAVINNNTFEYDAFRMARKRTKDLLSLQQEVSEIKGDLHDIKGMLLQLLGNK